MNYRFFLMSFLLLTSSYSCTSQNSKSSLSNDDSQFIAEQLTNVQEKEEQIAEYIPTIFEDSKGNIWMGTLGNGLAKYDGQSLRFYTKKDGLVGDYVVSIVEDSEENIWLATHSGLSKYDGKNFVNYTIEDDLIHHRMSNLLIDKNGLLWVGTWGGISRFDGESFQSFDIPNPKVKLESYQSTMHWVTELMEDSKGNIWIGRDGYGACKYNGKTFEHFTTKDGLYSNNIQEITEDSEGRIWFGSRITEKDHPDQDKRTGKAGVNVYDGMTMTNFNQHEGLSKNDVYLIYPEDDGAVWISAVGIGLYKYKNDSMKLYSEHDRMDLFPIHAVQGILRDSKGILWLGYNGGLFQMRGDSIINIPRKDLAH